MMTGANPNTDWLEDCLALDEKGFVKTGPDLPPSDLAARIGLSAARRFCSRRAGPASSPSGTCAPAASSALRPPSGEGSVCIQLVHKVLAE